MNPLGMGDFRDNVRSTKFKAIASGFQEKLAVYSVLHT